MPTGRNKGVPNRNISTFNLDMYGEIISESTVTRNRVFDDILKFYISFGFSLLHVDIFISALYLTIPRW